MEIQSDLALGRIFTLFLVCCANLPKYFLPTVLFIDSPKFSTANVCHSMILKGCYTVTQLFALKALHDAFCTIVLGYGYLYVHRLAISRKQKLHPTLKDLFILGLSCFSVFGVCSSSWGKLCSIYILLAAAIFLYPHHAHLHTLYLSSVCLNLQYIRALPVQ